MRIVKQPAAATEALINGAWPLGLRNNAHTHEAAKRERVISMRHHLISKHGILLEQNYGIKNKHGRGIATEIINHR